MAVIRREDVVMRARSYMVRKNIVTGTVVAITRAAVEAEKVSVDDDMLIVDVSTLPGFSVMILKAEVPAELHSVLKQLVGQEIPLLLLRVSGEVAYGSYSAALNRRRPVSDETPEAGVVRAVLARSLLVEVGNAVYAIPRHRATESRVERLVELFTQEQKDIIVFHNREPFIAQNDPWKNILLKPGDLVAGTVIDTFSSQNYVLIEIEPGLKGIANIPLRGRVERHDKVAAYVASIDPEKRKLRLRVSRKLPAADGGAW